MQISAPQLAELLLGIARAQAAIVQGLESEMAGVKSGRIMPALQNVAHMRDHPEPTLTDLPVRVLLGTLGRQVPDTAGLVRDLERLEGLEPFADDAAFRERWMAVKAANREVVNEARTTQEQDLRAEAIDEVEEEYVRRLVPWSTGVPYDRRFMSPEQNAAVSEIANSAATASSGSSEVVSNIEEIHQAASSSGSLKLEK